MANPTFPLRNEMDRQRAELIKRYVDNGVSQEAAELIADQLARVNEASDELHRIANGGEING